MKTFPVLATLVLSIVAAVAAPSASAQDNGADSRPLQVVDATGKVIGRLDNGNVVMTIGDGRVSIPLARLGRAAQLTWADTNAQYITFHSSDCTGTGYVSQDLVPPGTWGTLPGLVALVGDHAWLYVADQLDIRGVQGVQGSTLQYGVCKPRRSGRADGAWVFSAPPIDLAAIYVQPFTVR